MRLRESVVIHAAPDRVFRFFQRMETNYLRWHPDHLAFDWEGDGGLREGARFRLEERIGGKVIRRTMVLTNVVPAGLVEFAPANRFVRLLMPRLSFRIAEVPDGSRLEAEIRVRTGPVGAWLNRREFDAVRRHMREECENLKRIVEG